MAGAAGGIGGLSGLGDMVKGIMGSAGGILEGLKGAMDSIKKMFGEGSPAASAADAATKGGEGQAQNFMSQISQFLSQMTGGGQAQT